MCQIPQGLRCPEPALPALSWRILLTRGHQGEGGSDISVQEEGTCWSEPPNGGPCGWLHDKQDILSISMFSNEGQIGDQVSSVEGSGAWHRAILPTPDRGAVA